MSSTCLTSSSANSAKPPTTPNLDQLWRLQLSVGWGRPACHQIVSRLKGQKLLLALSRYLFNTNFLYLQFCITLLPPKNHEPHPSNYRVMDRIEEFSVPNQIQFHLGGHPPSPPTWGGRSCARTIGLDKSVHFRSRTEHKKCPIVCRGWLNGRALASDRPTKPGAVGIHHHVTAHFSLETAKSTFGMKNCSSEPQMGPFLWNSNARLNLFFCSPNWTAVKTSPTSSCLISTGKIIPMPIRLLLTRGGGG